MRETTDLLAAVLSGSHTVTSSLACYYDGAPVMDDVPIVDGSLDLDDGNAVQGSLKVSIPRYVDTDGDERVDMLPTSPGSPLSADGTRLAVTYTVGFPGGARESVSLGWFRIDDWTEGDGTIEVDAFSLQSVVEEAKFLDTVQVAAGTTFPDAGALILGGLLPLVVTADASRTSAGTAYEDDRLAALLDLVATWPARQYVNDQATLVIAPAYDDATDPVVAVLTDGEDGTVVRAPVAGSRHGVYNAVKASGEAPGAGDGEVIPVSGVMYLTDGPRRWNGPFGNVPYFMSSTLLTTADQCYAAARTRLQNLQMLAAPVTIDAAPDPRLQLGDVIGLRQAGKADRVLRVDAIGLPLTATGGTMTIRGHELTGRVIP